MGDSNADPAPVRPEVRVRDRDDSTGDPVDASVPRDLDRCATCESVIEPDAYRLTYLLEGREGSVERHYCSEACFPDDLPRRSTVGTVGPRDWSYCR